MASKRNSSAPNKQRDSSLEVKVGGERESNSVSSAHSSTVFMVDPFNFHSPNAKRDSSASGRSSVSDFIRKRGSNLLGSELLFSGSAGGTVLGLPSDAHRGSSFSIPGLDGNEIVFDFDNDELTELLLRLTSPSAETRATPEMDEKAIRETIEKGADVNYFEEGLGCPLQNAIFAKNRSVIQILLDAKANVNTSNVFLASPLSVALHFNAGLDVVKLLIDSKAGLHDRLDASTVLHDLATATEGDTELIPCARLLLDAGVWDYLPTANKNRATAAEVASGSKKSELYRYLCQQEQDCRGFLRKELVQNSLPAPAVDVVFSYVFE